MCVISWYLRLTQKVSAISEWLINSSLFRYNDISNSLTKFKVSSDSFVGCNPKSYMD